MKQNKETHGQGAGGRSSVNAGARGRPKTPPPWARLCVLASTASLCQQSSVSSVSRVSCSDLLFRPLVQTSLSLSSMSVPMSVPMSAHMSMVPTECTTTMGEGVTQLRTQGEGNQSRERQRGEKETIGIGINGAKVEPANERRLLAIPRVEYGVGWCCFRALRHVFVHSVMFWCTQSCAARPKRHLAHSRERAGKGRQGRATARTAAPHYTRAAAHYTSTPLAAHNTTSPSAVAHTTTHDSTPQHTTAHDMTPLHSTAHAKRTLTQRGGAY